MIDEFGGFGGDGLFSLFFIIFIAIFLFVMIGGVIQWMKNNNSPRLTVPAVVTAKRSKVSGGGAGDVHHSSSTWYYATFEVESGDRMELAVSGREFGQLADGDRGMLTFQGTRYVQFERIIRE